VTNFKVGNLIRIPAGDALFYALVLKSERVGSTQYLVLLINSVIARLSVYSNKWPESLLTIDRDMYFIIPAKISVI
jgi:hypothetical protein